MLLDRSHSAFLPSHDGSSHRLRVALERAYETPATRASELRDALTTFVSQLRAVGVEPRQVALVLRKLVLRSAPSKRYWPAYGALSDHLVRWGLDVYHHGA